MFSLFIPRAESKSHVPTKPASPDMFDADNTVGKIRPKTPTEVMERPTEVLERPTEVGLQAAMPIAQKPSGKG